MNKKKGGVLQDALSTFGTNAFGAVLALISSFCIMPVLDPGESGLITQNQMVGSALFTLLSFSVNSSMIYYVSRCKLKNVVRSIKRVSVALTLLIAAVGTAVVLCCAAGQLFCRHSHPLLHLRCLLRCIFVCLQCFPCHFARGKQIPCL